MSALFVTLVSTLSSHGEHFVVCMFEKLKHVPPKVAARPSRFQIEHAPTKEQTARHVYAPAARKIAQLQQAAEIRHVESTSRR